jgi:secreted PhoX family phosphatase
MRAVVVGKPLKEGEKYADEYYCHPDYIANPDNIKYAGHHTLLIGEDTKYHVNNYLWAYNTQTGTMTRIASLPIGAEVTGLEKGFIGDKGLLFINQQHPFKDNPKNAKGEKPNSYLIEKATEEDFKAKIGYVDGVPSDIFQ